MMPLMILSCSRTLAMLGAVNWKTRDDDTAKTQLDLALLALQTTCLASLPEITDVATALIRSADTAQFFMGHLERRDAGVGAILVDLIHGPLQSHGLLGEILEVL